MPRLVHSDIQISSPRANTWWMDGPYIYPTASATQILAKLRMYNPGLASHATVVADMDVCNKHHQGDGLQPYALNFHSGPEETSTSGESVPFLGDSMTARPEDKGLA